MSDFSSAALSSIDVATATPHSSALHMKKSSCVNIEDAYFSLYWMKMLKVRNELAHDYDGEIVKEHCQTIVQTYIDLFYDFEKTVKKPKI